jgi:hypothetical protein
MAGLNLAALRAKLDEMNNPKKGQNFMFKPEKGLNTIRVLPLASDPSNPFQEVSFHFNLGGKTYLSPDSYGERDPIKEFADSIISQGGLTKEEFKEVVKFRPALRTYLPVIVRGKEDEGVKFWSFGKDTLKKILAVMADEDYGDITDPKSGRDLKITYTPQEDSDTNFAKTEVMPSPKITPLSTKAEELDKWLNNQPVLLDVVGKRHTYDELQAVLQRVLNPESANTASAPATTGVVAEPWADEPAPAVKQRKAAVSADVEADFDKLFSEES